MRKLSLALAATLLVLGSASVSGAATAPYSGAVGLQIATLQAQATGTGIALINGSAGRGHLTSLQLASGDIAVTGLSIPVTDPAAAPIGGLQLTAQNGVGSFVSGAGVMPLVGFSKVCLFGPCSAAAANIAVPLSNVGAGGSTAVGIFVNVTVTGAPWTTGAVPFGTVAVSGFAHGPASLTSSTANTTGAIRYVTPVFISTNIPASAVVPAFGFLDIHFGIPEPGTLVLLGSGIAGLVMVGRARARKS